MAFRKAAKLRKRFGYKYLYLSWVLINEVFNYTLIAKVQGMGAFNLQSSVYGILFKIRKNTFGEIKIFS